jgi:hypothetical protein
MSEGKRVASFGIKIDCEADEHDEALIWFFEVFDKQGVIIRSQNFPGIDECKDALIRLRKVCKNRYTSTKITN